MIIGERIKQRRIELGITPEELGRYIGKSRATIYRYENGDIEDMPISIVEPLAKALCTTPSALVGWGDIEERRVKERDTFLKVLNDCFTKEQILLLRIALKAKMKVYFYGCGLGKSLLAEVLVNAGFDVDEPGLQRPCYYGALEVKDEDGLVAFCVKNTPREYIPHLFDILLGCPTEIVEWVNQ